MTVIASLSISAGLLEEQVLRCLATVVSLLCV